MSLINKMLQDLDARGGAQSGQGSVPQMRPVAAGAQTPRAVLLAGAGAAVILLAAAGWLGWRSLRAPAATAPLAPQAAQAQSAQAQAVQVPAARAPSAPALSGAASATAAHTARPSAATSALAATPNSAEPAAKSSGHRQRGQDADLTHETKAQARQRRMAEQQAAADLAAELKAAKSKARQAKIEAARLAAAGAPVAASRGKAESAAPASDARRRAEAIATANVPAATAGMGSRKEEAASAALAAKARRSADLAAGRATREADVVARPGTGGVTVTSQQQGENAYRRGLAALQEGRVQEAISNMEQAVFLFPRHDNARQTLVGLLIESKRHDEAMRNLQIGLGLDPKQPQMAMILARLQIEKGGPAIETLQRTLPYAGGNSDYIAFLAGALQRAQRYREAAEQYQAALRLQPQNGVWWMGLGIALQADKRNAEALDAFTRARNAGNLSQELQNFVDRKLQQLGR